MASQLKSTDPDPRRRLSTSLNCSYKTRHKQERKPPEPAHTHSRFGNSVPRKQQAVELSQRLQTAVQIVSKSPTQSIGGPIYRLFGTPSCGPAGWLALLLIKAGYVETNPGSTTTHKLVWIYDICHKQIHGRKQIAIRYNRIEHWVHLRCADIRQA